MFEIINNVYTKKNFSWISELNEIPSPVIVLKWLSMNLSIQKSVRVLNRYAFILSPPEFLALSMATIPRQLKAPFVKFVKAEENEQYEELFNKIQYYGKYGDSDMIIIKKKVLVEIEKDKLKWFKTFGMDEKFYADNGVDFKDIKEKVIKGKSGLDFFS